MSAATRVDDQTLHALLHRCKQRSGLSFQELDNLASICAELTLLRHIVEKVVMGREALESGADLLANDAADEQKRADHYPIDSTFRTKYQRRADLSRTEAAALRSIAEAVKEIK
jgi:hypothetical protein